MTLCILNCVFNYTIHVASIFPSFTWTLIKKGIEIYHSKVQIGTRQKMIKKLTKEIEESKKEKESLAAEKENCFVPSKIEHKSFVVKENRNLHLLSAFHDYECCIKVVYSSFCCLFIIL